MQRKMKKRRKMKMKMMVMEKGRRRTQEECLIEENLFYLKITIHNLSF